MSCVRAFFAGPRPVFGRCAGSVGAAGAAGELDAGEEAGEELVRGAERDVRSAEEETVNEEEVLEVEAVGAEGEELIEGKEDEMELEDEGDDEIEDEGEGRLESEAEEELLAGTEPIGRDASVTLGGKGHWGSGGERVRGRGAML
jgi:hypothetical protein